MPTPPFWGSRGRRFKSGRPDAGQRLVPGFQLPAPGCNGSARALPSVAPTPRSGLSCRLGMLTSDNWHQRVRVPALAPSPPTRVSFPPGQGVAGSDPAVKACRAAAPASAQPPVRPIQPHPSTRDDPAHRPPEPGACSAIAAPSSRPPAGPVQPSFGPPRQGSPPTCGLEVGCPAAPGVLPAQLPHADARKAHIAQGYGQRLSHKPSHGIQAAPAGSITVSDGDCQGERTPSRLIWSGIPVC